MEQIPLTNFGEDKIGLKSLSLLPNSPEPTQQGHIIGKTLLFKKSNEILYLLNKIVGSWKRADMVYRGLALQAVHGECFASAAYLANDQGNYRHPNKVGSHLYSDDGEFLTALDVAKSRIHGSEKTWDRVLKFLKQEKLVIVSRLQRRGGRHATNLIDFYPLWSIIIRLLQQKGHYQIDRLRSGVWIKTGQWVLLEDFV